MIETRNVSDEVLQQNVWGTTYVDELVQIGINQDPSNATSGTATENVCERFFWVCQDANYNVLGVVSPHGDLVERYEYTPYGRRRVFTRGWILADIDGDGWVDGSQQGADYAIWDDESGANPASRADLNGDGVVNGADYTALVDADGDSVDDDDLVRIESPHSFLSPVAGTSKGASLCDIGHQGLIHDKEFGLIYNRARYLHPTLGRFVNRDPKDSDKPGGGYHDGMNLYEYVRSNPVGLNDPMGLKPPGGFRTPGNNPADIGNVTRGIIVNRVISIATETLTSWIASKMFNAGQRMADRTNIEKVCANGLAFGKANEADMASKGEFRGMRETGRFWGRMRTRLHLKAPKGILNAFKGALVNSVLPGPPLSFTVYTGTQLFFWGNCSDDTPRIHYAVDQVGQIGEKTTGKVGNMVVGMSIDTGSFSDKDDVLRGQALVCFCCNTFYRGSKGRK